MRHKHHYDIEKGLGTNYYKASANVINYKRLCAHLDVSSTYQEGASSKIKERHMMLKEILIFSIIGLAFGDWANKYDGPVYFRCPKGESIAYIQSVHSNKREDRLYRFKCRKINHATGQVYWTNYVNCWDETFHTYCPPGFIMTGQHSYHKNHHEDRRFKLRCTQVINKRRSNCRWTRWTKYDGRWTYRVKANYYLIGMRSRHSNRREDRQFSFRYCKLR